MSKWDVITLSGLTAVGNHGVYDFERDGSQEFVADLTLYVDARKAAQSDDVADTVDYSKVAEDAVAVLSGPAVFLIETLASRLAEIALGYPGVHRAKVTVHKPMAPLEQQFTDVSVTVIRERRQGVPTIDANLPSAAKVQPATNRPPVETNQGRPKVLTPPPPAPPAPKPAKVAPEVRPEPRSRHTGKHGRPSPEPTYRATPSRPKPHVYDVVLALGANQGPAVQNLRGAVEALGAVDGFEIDSVSPLVRTQPVLEQGALPQDDYYNAIVVAKTVLAPPALLEATQGIEQRFGRVRTSHWGARTLDIDIIDLDHMLLNLKKLTLPHPRAHVRAFVLYPWLLADSQAHLPRHGFARDLLPRTDDLGGILFEYPDWLEQQGNDPGAAVEVHLAPRPARSRQIHLDGTSPQVVLRGQGVRLADVEGDPIFQSLLDREQREARKTPRARAQAKPRTVVKPPPPPRPRSQVAPTPVREAAPTPVLPRASQDLPAKVVDPSPQVKSRVPSLPNWEFAQRSRRVRVVDSVDAPDDVHAVESIQTPLEGIDVQQSLARRHAIETEAERPRLNGPTTTEERSPITPAGSIPKVARHVTVRPTPTGSVPVFRLPKRGNGSGKHKA
ncbi:2-amino-4-hydroxy-6-hydroxymethyldihydropteridine diphosphokinase [Actinomyces minihominis]|uniref:2-amino-4-hydroxy-6- hydroxymethyldihydropteridine diphosphokinase n=1 Tax=Actinomyces minihominis TaxID=2002838 RepID=UPI000C08D040|nr:2-amino-4-hydroxy-6-hydroxymethyldihydropteridine diphosphokinase [Actinomyces minihominis]